LFEKIIAMFLRSKFFIKACFIIVLALGMVLGLSTGILTPDNFSFLSSVHASPEDSSSSKVKYPEVGSNQGVWYDGQAALWDFDFIDHFRIFGARERAKGFQPEQPINFSHVIHVQQLKMECQFCHWNVAKSSYATIPEVETCMGCHKLVTLADGVDEKNQPKAIKGRESGFKEIQKIKEFYDAKQPIPWKKVHVMPDHVRFNHKRHVKAGVGCQECHGQIPEMDVVHRVSSMKMGWCIDCHRERGTSIDCLVCHK